MPNDITLNLHLINLVHIAHFCSQEQRMEIELLIKENKTYSGYSVQYWV